MKPNNSLELNIRLKIALMFVIVIAYVVGVYFYSDNLKKNIDAQKEEMNRFNNILSKTEKLISTVQEVQNIMNENLTSAQAVNLQQIDSLTQEISFLTKDLKSAIPQNETTIYLEDIDSLLNEKRITLNTLISKLKQKNPIQQIDKKIETYDEMVKDSVITTTVKDTTLVIKEKEEKRDLWSRFKNFVKPAQKQDTVIQISEIEKETILTTRADTTISRDLKSAAKEASIIYSVQIIGIEKQVREMILAEQNISLQISKLLTEFFNETTKIAQEGIRESELLTRRIFTFAIFIGSLALFLLVIIILFIISDLNKGRKARFDLAAEKQLTDALMESRHKLLLSVSHDIKTPLSSIMGYLQIWNDETKSNLKDQQLKSAQNSAQHILNLVYNLLEYSRLEQNNAVLHQSRFNLFELIEEIIQMFQPMADEKNLKIEQKQLLENPFWIETDKTVLKQILNNIISNAIKYTNEGIITIKSLFDSQLIFEVTDTGIGMTEKELEEIFKPFSRGQTQFASEGSGFGMYVTKGLIEALNGEIIVHSVKDKGTNVKLSFPIHPDNKIETKSVEDKNSSTHKHFKNILIFEDDIPLGTMVKTFLTQNNYQVELCHNYKLIDEYIEQISKFDIVFTDMDMIQIDGHEILRKIRKINAEIPVWLMTANDDYISQKSNLRGFSGIIEKPIQLHQLGKVLNVEKKVSKQTNRLSQEFPTLSEMMGDDEESILEILSTFVTSIHQDIKELKKFIELSKFNEAQKLCHRMHPFITQVEGGSLYSTFIKMDAFRGDEKIDYPNWESELSESVEQLENFVNRIETNYLQKMD